jgi:type I restriction enzyme S subunit
VSLNALATEHQLYVNHHRECGGDFGGLMVDTAEWKAAKLDELGFVGRGKSRHRPRNAQHLYGGPYPFFQTGDIKAANFYLNEFSQTYSEEGLAQSKLWKPGTLCITIAANIAESAILGVEGCFPDSVVGFIADPDKADVRFIKYYMEILKLQMQNVSHGATQDNLSVDKLLSFDFLVPPLPVQQRIAGVLSAYDELIENNQRRIKILESMARNLYREWFVHFRFPGHENHPRVASPLGEIPAGWDVGQLDDVLVLQRGFDLPKALRAEGAVPIIASTGVTGFHNKAKVKAPGVVTGRSGTIGEVLYVQEDFWPLNTSLWVKEFPKSEPLYAYYLLSSLNLKQFSAGAAVPTLNRNSIHGMPVVVPPRGLQRRFQEIAGTIFIQFRTLNLKNESLRHTRDLLLPRLLSGQIKLEDV